jgi:hypothetical protein
VIYSSYRKEVMDYNNLFSYKEGLLLWKESPAPNVKANSLAGSLRKDGYIGIFVNRKYLFAHRIIWTMFNGGIPEDKVIDHIDGIRHHNKIENLRICTFQENHFNRGKQSNNKSGYKGVSWHSQKKRWVAQIKIQGKNKFLGFFNDPILAYEKYCEKAIEHYGEYAKL